MQTQGSRVQTDAFESQFGSTPWERIPVGVGFALQPRLPSSRRRGVVSRASPRWQPRPGTAVVCTHTHAHTRVRAHTGLRPRPWLYPGSRAALGKKQKGQICTLNVVEVFFMEKGLFSFFF